MTPSRRNFLKRSFIFVATLQLSAPLSRFLLAQAGEPVLPAGQVAVPATDAVASAIGYQSSMKGVKRKPDEAKRFCKNCALYTALPGSKDWGKCQMLTSGLVTAEGWCRSWNKRA